jgi:Transposase DDE domain
MRFLHAHHITDLYCFVDDLVKPSLGFQTGRPALLGTSEIITILVWDILVLRQPTLKDLHTKLLMYHRGDFPKFPKYNAFLDSCHRALPILATVLMRLLVTDAPVRILDSTKLPVCTIKRADHHKVAKDIAQFGKNHQGWWYGFKLHAAVTLEGKLSATAITPANMHDAQMIPKLLNKHAKVAVGDSHYGAKVMGRKMWQEHGTVIIAPPHFTQKRKIAADWQLFLLSQRSKIESVFDYLKNHLSLVTSFPRSVNGYLLHYLKVLVGYQIMMVG